MQAITITIQEVPERRPARRTTPGELLKKKQRIYKKMDSLMDLPNQ